MLISPGLPHTAEWLSTGWGLGPWFARWRWRRGQEGQRRRPWERSCCSSACSLESAAHTLPSSPSTRAADRLCRDHCSAEPYQPQVSVGLFLCLCVFWYHSDSMLKIITYSFISDLFLVVTCDLRGMALGLGAPIHVDAPMARRAPILRGMEKSKEKKGCW